MFARSFNSKYWSNCHQIFITYLHWCCQKSIAYRCDIFKCLFFKNLNPRSWYDILPLLSCCRYSYYSRIWRKTLSTPRGWCLHYDSNYGRIFLTNFRKFKSNCCQKIKRVTWPHNVKLFESFTSLFDANIYFYER